MPELIADGSGLPVPMPGTGAILRVVFRGAQAHTADGTASTITSAPAPSHRLPGPHQLRPGRGLRRRRQLRDRRRPAGDPVPETKVRVYEVEKIEQGQHLYVVAVQLDASSWK